MNLRSTLIGLVTVSSLFLAPASMAMPDEGDPAETRAECLQRCFDTLTANLANCESTCTVCDTWIWFICIGHHLDNGCYAICKNAANITYNGCVEGCPAK